ncbi:DEAD/DEAH box helicase, partial [Candidatus Woesearchaeota archaeon]|nr:DEAD/DEAH box helicase [Candidatus Woesearchaeota archaeon]
MTPTKEYRDKKIKQKSKESGFTKLGLDKDLIEALAKQDIVEPTKVQEQVVPLVLGGRDLLCMSETGSGKTVSFALPIINQLKGHGGARVLVVAPTRELAKQIAGEFRKFSRHKGLKTVTVYGGVSMQPQIEKIPEADVVVGTPGRLLDLHRQNYLKL